MGTICLGFVVFLAGFHIAATMFAQQHRSELTRLRSELRAAQQRTLHLMSTMRREEPDA